MPSKRQARHAEERIVLSQRLSTPITSRKKFRLARVRYTAMDAELHSAASYFQQLAAEIDASAVASNKHSQIWERAETIRKEIEQLRRDLEQVQRQQGEA